MQVSNVVSPKTNGKLQLSHPLNGGYVGGSVVDSQTARNPADLVLSLDLNLILMELELLMKLHG